MRHPVPTIGTADVMRLLARDFGDAAATARDLLAPLDSTHPGAVARVSAAVLKLADGDLAELRAAVGLATTDWRDAIAAAEYPRYTALPGDASPSVKAAAIDGDWEAYQRWLMAPEES